MVNKLFRVNSPGNAYELGRIPVLSKAAYLFLGRGFRASWAGALTWLTTKKISNIHDTQSVL